ncbi:VOC family protein [Zavarzinia compransoris]|uniref:VOC family protein n=1 Tax=Zavarzinia marina TaxID=2911065 RepID=UPI001F1D2214|nr:VOC family protein [Zavarzinia marina]MCF4166253.1 VOC family protein [Zavarzinia marina]
MSETATTMPQPEVKGGFVPYLMIDGALKAADFYVRAFGAEIVASIPPDEKGRTMHVHLYLNGSSLMLADAYPEHGAPLEMPQAFELTIQVDDIDPWWDRAVAAGATVLMPVQTMFWGARYGRLRDPFGVSWSMNQPIEGGGDRR